MARLRLPTHVGFIPDGNRRWAQAHGLMQENGYFFGIAPGITLLEECRRRGIAEVSIFGFTQDNAKRPPVQREAFRRACGRFAVEAAARGAALRVIGDSSSGELPKELRAYLSRSAGDLRVNLLANYAWDWDLDGLKGEGLRSRELPRLDLIVRWGGGRRLSGFLPVQSVYADLFTVEELWPDFESRHLDDALEWYRAQDPTFGG